MRECFLRQPACVVVGATLQLCSANVHGPECAPQDARMRPYIADLECFFLPGIFNHWLGALNDLSWSYDIVAGSGNLSSTRRDDSVSKNAL